MTARYATQLPFHFGDLSPDDFERLIHSLVKRSGEFDEAQVYGGARDKGRDVVAYKHTAAGREKWYIQCKRYKEIFPSTLCNELDKVAQHAKNDPRFAPDVIVFATACPIPPQTKDRTTTYARQLNLPEPYYWGRLELDERLKTQPDTEQEFFGLRQVIPPVLHQLPPALPDFVGRREVAGELLSVLGHHGDGAACVAIVGMGGTGKTALAIHVARQLSDRYADAQIVVDLHGASDRPLLPTEAMEQVIHAFHPEMPLPDEPSQLRARYHDTLGGQEALILLDDAAGTAQIEPLIPGPPCGLIITSRNRRIALSKFHESVYYLGAFEIHEARDLLQAIVGKTRATPAELETIAQLCGGLPLALRVAGNFLAVHLDWSAAEYIEELSKERERLARLSCDDLDVEAALGQSVAQLARDHPSLAVRWKMLSIFPASFDRAAVTAVWHAEESETRDQLSELTKRCLVFYDMDSHRYRLHDLMRAFAHRSISEKDELVEKQKEARLRLALWYATKAVPMERRLQPVTCQQEANEVAERTGQSPEQVQETLIAKALAWFETERPNLVAAMRWASQAEDQNLVKKLARNTVGFFNIRGHWSDWEQSQRSALAAARKTGDRRGEATAYALLGNAYRVQGRWAVASEMLEEALSISQEAEEPDVVECIARNLLANCYRLQGRWKEAINMFKEGLRISREIENLRGVAIALGGLGNTYRMQGNYEDALDVYEESLRISRETGDSYGEGITLNNKGLVYCMQGEYDDAVEALESSMKIAERLRSPRGKSVCLRILGEVDTRQGRLDGAIGKFQESLDIACDTGDLRVQSQSLDGLGRAYTKKEEWEDAEQAFTRGLSVLRRLNDRHGEGITLRGLGLLREAQGRKDDAVAMWRESLTKLHPDSPEYEDVAERLQEV